MDIHKKNPLTISSVQSESGNIHTTALGYSRDVPFPKSNLLYFFESRTDELTELCSGIVSFISSKRPKNADFLSIIELVLYSPRSPDSKSNCMSSHPYVRNSFITGQGNISQFRIDKKDQFYLNDLVKNAF